MIYFRILRCRDYPGLSPRAQHHQESLKEGGAGRREGRGADTDGFEGRGSGRGPVAFSSTPQQKASSLQSLWKPTTHRSMLDSDLQNRKRPGLCGVKPLHL